MSRTGFSWRVLSNAVAVLSIVMLAGWSDQARSQETYPSKPIQVLVPFNAGGSIDVMHRIIADHIKAKWGVPVNVVNKPGGNTLPAVLEVYRAPPDGYTLLADQVASTSQLESVVPDLPIKVMDRTIMPMMFYVPLLIVVPANSPHKTLKDLDVEAKKSPESFTWTSLGGASSQDFIARQFFRAIGADVLKTKPMMSTGGSQSVIDTAGGVVKMGVVTYSAARPQIDANLIRVLAVSSRERYSSLPDIPTTAELGYPSVKFATWTSYSGPPNMPADVVAKWDAAIRELTKDKEVLSKMTKFGVAPAYLSAKDTRDFILKETEEVKILWGGK